MENCKKFFETSAQFKKDLAKIEKAETLKELNELESRCVNELQLMIVEVEMCGRDLRALRDKRDREIRDGQNG